MNQLGSFAVLIEPGYGFLLGWEGSVFNFLRTDSQQCPHHFLSAVQTDTNYYILFVLEFFEQFARFLQTIR